MITREIILEGEKHIMNHQITADGEFYFFATREMKLGGQPVRIEVAEMREEFTDGRMSAIHTLFIMYALDNQGYKIDPTGQNPRYAVKMPMTANARDRKDFVRSEAPRLVYSMWNGYVRSPLGYNYLPPYNSATGQFIDYTPEEEAAPPTWDYYTHHSDGTLIDPPTQGTTTPELAAGNDGQLLLQEPATEEPTAGETGESQTTTEPDAII